MSVFQDPAYAGHESVTFVHDSSSGLRAVIAVHSTVLGPAVGGCRMYPYESDSMALTDVLRLSRGMSFKNAVANLPLGGGKAVIIGDPRTQKTRSLFEAFGRAVEQLGGRYVTAEDVGVGVGDMEIVAGQTRYVSGLPQARGKAVAGDPSPKTARGVFHGIRASVLFAMGRQDVEGIKVAVQGLGSVGYHLCRELHAAGAQLVVADVDQEKVARVRDELGASVVSTAQILFQPVDVVAPCALGGILNQHTIPRLSTRVVAGAANNQLLTDQDGERLMRRGILYAPDYVINAGGIINAAAEYLNSMSEAQVRQRICDIETQLSDIYASARSCGYSTNVVADRLAWSLLHGGTVPFH